MELVTPRGSAVLAFLGDFVVDPPSPQGLKACRLPGLIAALKGRSSTCFQHMFPHTCFQRMFRSTGSVASFHHMIRVT